GRRRLSNNMKKRWAERKKKAHPCGFLGAAGTTLSCTLDPVAIARWMYAEPGPDLRGGSLKSSTLSAFSIFSVPPAVKCRPQYGSSDHRSSVSFRGCHPLKRGGR